MQHGRLISTKHDSLAKLRFYPISAKKTAGVTMCRVGRTIVAVDGKGRIYSSSIAPSTGLYYIDISRNGQRDLVAGMIKLGVVTKAVVDQHNLDCENDTKLSAIRYAAERIVENAKELGVELTKAQLAKIKKAAT